MCSCTSSQVFVRVSAAATWLLLLNYADMCWTGFCLLGSWDSIMLLASSSLWLRTFLLFLSTATLSRTGIFFCFTQMIMFSSSIKSTLNSPMPSPVCRFLYTAWCTVHAELLANPVSLSCFQNNNYKQNTTKFLGAFKGYSFLLEVSSHTWMVKTKPQVSLETTKSQGITYKVWTHHPVSVTSEGMCWRVGFIQKPVH